MVPLIAADALMDQVMSQLRARVLQAVPHPAEGHQVELADVEQALRDLPARELDEDAEDARLRAEKRRLAGLPRKAAWTEHVPVLDAAGRPVTYGAKWRQAGPAERREWLRDAAFSVRLARPAMLAWDEDGDEDAGADGMLSTADTYTSEDAALVFEWTGDDDAGLGRGLLISEQEMS